MSVLPGVGLCQLDEVRLVVDLEHLAAGLVVAGQLELHIAC